MSRERRVFSYNGGKFESITPREPEVNPTPPEDTVEPIDSVQTDPPPSGEEKVVVKSDKEALDIMGKPINVKPVSETEVVSEEGVVESEPVTSNEESETVEEEVKEQDVPSQETPSETDNFFLAAAERMKKSGYLPEDFQLDPGLSEDEADTKIYTSYLETLKPQVHQELLAEFQQEIAKLGYDQNTLAYANMLRNGVPEENIRGIQNYANLAEYDLTSASREDKLDYIRRMYIDRGWNKKEIERALASAEVDDEVDNLSTETKEYFDSKKKETLKITQQEAERHRQQQEKILQYNQAVISEVFNKGEIGGEKMTDDDLDIFEEAIYTRSIPVQVDGKVTQITPFDQFRHAMSNDIALQLWAFKKLLFREKEIERLKTVIQKEAEENKVIKWGKRTTKIETPSPTNKTTETKTKPVSPSKSGNTFIFEGGEFKQVPQL